MTSCFKIGNVLTSDIEVLREVEKALDLHAYETSDLIHQYYLQLLGYQQGISRSEFGQLTIKANFTRTELVVGSIVQFKVHDCFKFLKLLNGISAPHSKWEKLGTYGSKWIMRFIC